LQFGKRFRLPGLCRLFRHLAKNSPFGNGIATSSHAVKCLRAAAEAAHQAHL
jgi:hypothetical protein